MPVRFTPTTAGPVGGGLTVTVGDIGDSDGLAVPALGSWAGSGLTSTTSGISFPRGPRPGIPNPARPWVLLTTGRNH